MKQKGRNLVQIIFGLSLTWTTVQAAPLTPQVADKSKVPYRYAGKLFLVGDGNEFVELCSAQYAGANDVVLTAAHCVIDKAGNTLHAGNLVFLHGYNANTPLKASKVSQLVTCIALPNAYRANKPNHDYAFLKMQAAGSQGHFTLGRGMMDAEVVTSTGYPSNFNSGKELMAVHGARTKYSDLIIKDVQLFKGNPFGDGSSGGAWVNPAKEVIGVNAKILGTPGGPASDDNQVISPIFDDTFKKLFDYANAGCSGTNP
ncbi:trypsin-like serine peptidase [Leisingera sp. JC1]|uniref:trypsin-like serine peptidase n=1 Tax=Leisingera sp. JC1 TaxID=1855282 RepID=UPI0015861896|nr:trypsin-like peptidase domain-containing protein [Leisingera sp. JC1]